MADKIQFRRDTAANWTAYNPILLEGEIGYVLNTQHYKLGDGIHAWNDLELHGFNGNIESEVTNNKDSVPSSAAVYNFLPEYAIIYYGTPELNTSAKTFKLPAGSDIFHKGGRLYPTAQDVIWTRSEGQQSVYSIEFLILNISDYSHRVVHALELPKCSDEECVIALVDWNNYVMQSNIKTYLLNGSLINNQIADVNAYINKIKLPKFVYTPIFWRNGHIEVLHEGSTIRARVAESSLFFINDSYVSVEATQEYVSIESMTTVFIGLSQNNGVYSLVLADNSWAHDTFNNFYLITEYFTGQQDLYNSKFSEINCTYKCYITFNGKTELAIYYAYKRDLPSVYSLENEEDGRLKYGRKGVYASNFLQHSNSARLVSKALYLQANKTYLLVVSAECTDYVPQVSDSTQTQVIGGNYSNRARLITVPNDGIIYIWLKRVDDGDFTTDDLEKINESQYILLYSSDAIDLTDSVLPLMKWKNLFDSAEHEYGYYYASDSGTKFVNDAMVNSIVKVIPGTTLYIKGLYVQIAYFDNFMHFISGYYHNVESSISESYAFTPCIVPDNAVYAALSVRKPQEKTFYITCFPYANKGCESNNKMDNVFIPQTNIVSQDLRKVFDDKDFIDPVSYMGWETKNCSVSDSKIVLASNGKLNCFRNRFITLDRSTIGTMILINSVSGANWIFRFGYFGSVYSGNSVNDCDAWIQVYTNKAELYNGNLASGSANLKTTVNFSETISVGNEVFVKIVKDTINHYKAVVYKRDIVIGTLELTAAVDPNDQDNQLNQMRGWGLPGVSTNENSSVSISRIYCYSNGSQYPLIAVLGDSYIENFSRSNASGWARLLEDKIGKDNIFVSGMGGATAGNLIVRMPIELSLCKPRFVILNVGINDGTTASHAETYKTRLEQLINMVKSIDAKPILITTPRRGDNDNINFINVVNPWIKSLGYRYVDVAYCLSTGDGVTQDTNRYRPDLVHPNHVGAQAILNWIENYLPEIL